MKAVKQRPRSAALVVVLVVAFVLEVDGRQTRLVDDLLAQEGAFGHQGPLAFHQGLEDRVFLAVVDQEGNHQAEDQIHLEEGLQGLADHGSQEVALVLVETHLEEGHDLGGNRLAEVLVLVGIDRVGTHLEEDRP